MKPKFSNPQVANRSRRDFHRRSGMGKDARSLASFPGETTVPISSVRLA